MTLSPCNMNFKDQLQRLYRLQTFFTNALYNFKQEKSLH